MQWQGYTNEHYDSVGAGKFRVYCDMQHALGQLSVAVINISHASQ